MSGAQLTDRARRQAAKFGAEMLTTRDVVGLEVNGSARTVRFADGDSIDAHTVILATGVSYRQLAAPGLGQLTGRGIFYGSSLSESAGCAGQDVYIVGGANSAGQAAVYLSRGARSVTILVRAPSLETSMSYYLIQQIAEIPAISVRSCTEIAAAHGSDHLEQLTLRDSKTGATEMVDAQWLFVFIGAAPRTDWLDGVVVRDDRGFVVAGPDLSVEGQRPRGSARLTARPTTWRPASPGCSWPATRGRSRPSGSPPRWGKAHGRDARAPLPGEAMSGQAEGAEQAGQAGHSEHLPCSVAELRTLFLFEKLSEEQLAWLCREGHVERIEPGPVYLEGEPAACFYVLLEGTTVMSRRVGADDVDITRTSNRGVYAGAFNAYLGDRVPQVYNSSLRVTAPSRFFVLDAAVFAHMMREWFPMAVHLLEGVFFGAKSTREAIGQRERLLALGTLSAGLTHELNNPAAAAVRATSALRERVARCATSWA